MFFPQFPSCRTHPIARVSLINSGDLRPMNRKKGVFVRLCIVAASISTLLGGLLPGLAEVRNVVDELYRI